MPLHPSRLIVLAGILSLSCGRHSLPPEQGSGGDAGGASVPSDAAPLPPRCPSCTSGQECCLATGACFDPMTAPEACPRPAAEPPVGGQSGGGGTGGTSGASGHVPDPSKPPPGETPCSSNSHCPAGQYCTQSSEVFACVGVGYCSDRQCGSCTGSPDCETAAVCGCDGVTYPNQRAACQAGVRTAAPAACGTAVTVPGNPVLIGCRNDGMCPAGWACCDLTGRCYDRACRSCCGAPPPGTAAPCEKNEQCTPPYGFCQGNGCGTPGGCVAMPSPSDCGGELAEVCGCNGVSYTNACRANSVGVRVKHTGRCP